MAGGRGVRAAEWYSERQAGVVQPKSSSEASKPRFDASDGITPPSVESHLALHASDLLRHPAI